jgi:hypothetical protein
MLWGLLDLEYCQGSCDLIGGRGTLSISERAFGVVADHGLTFFARLALALDHGDLL